jgi:hypothetical protein
MKEVAPKAITNIVSIAILNVHIELRTINVTYCFQDASHRDQQSIDQ